MNKLMRVCREPSRIVAQSRYRLLSYQRKYFPAYAKQTNARRSSAIMTLSEIEQSQRKRLVAITGLPRSGTTLFTALWADMTNAVTLSEPYLQFLQTGFFRWRDGDGGERVCISSPSDFIVDRLKNSLTASVAFKETWRGDGANEFPNERFIRSIEKSGIKTVVVIRDPRACWQSNLDFCKMDQRRVPGAGFFTSYADILYWIKTADISYVKYEDLVEGTQSWVPDLAKQTGLILSPPGNTISKLSGMGDPAALEGGIIHKKSVERFKALDADILHMIEDGCAESMDKFGYYSVT